MVNDETNDFEIRNDQIKEWGIIKKFKNIDCLVSSENSYQRALKTLK